jgi:uncharacterized protein YbjT (DUF2867 family)
MYIARMNSARVLVIGATGVIGRAVVDDLLRANALVRALSRDAVGAELPCEAEVFTGDLTIPSSLDAALDDVSAVFLVWTAPAETVTEVITRIAERTQRIVFLSSPHNTPHPFFQQTPDNALAQLHAHIEREIARSGLVSTILRPGMFASNAVHWWARSIRNGAPIRWPYADAETAPIDERDVAAVAARVLCDGSHASGDYVLTGPQSLSNRDQVRDIGAVLGRDIEFVELSADEFRAETAGTWPAPIVEMLLAAWKGTLGVPALVTSSVEELTGSRGRTFREWVRDNADAFR